MRLRHLYYFTEGLNFQVWKVSRQQCQTGAANFRSHLLLPGSTEGPKPSLSCRETFESRNLKHLQKFRNRPCRPAGARARQQRFGTLLPQTPRKRPCEAAFRERGFTCGLSKSPKFNSEALECQSQSVHMSHDNEKKVTDACSRPTGLLS